MRLLVCFVWLMMGTFTASAQRLHVIYALEQTDRAYGLLNLRNEELMTQIMKTVEWGLGYPMQLTYLPKADFTRAALQRTLSGLKTGPNDVIVLYYSGFGVAPASPTATFSSWQLTDVPKQGLAVSEVERWLLAKKGRLRVLIAECQVQTTRNDTRVDAGVTLKEDLRKAVVRKLFRDPCGLIKLGSALPSQPTWADENRPGTIFANAFNSAFQTMLLTPDSATLATVSWAKLRGATEGDMARYLVKMPFSQKPVLEMKPCQPTQPVATPPADPLANETLAGLLNAYIVATNPVQRETFKNQLLTLCSEQTAVTVSRRLTTEFTTPMSPNDYLATQFTLGAYLAQVRKPLPVPPPATPASPPLPLMRLRVVFVDNKQVATDAQRVTALTLREEWTN